MNPPLQSILFLDIETVPQYRTFDDAPGAYAELWEQKAVYLKKEDEDTSEVYGRAGIYAEFGKIVCISVGIVNQVEGGQELRLKSFFGEDESLLLQEFAELLTKYFNSDQHYLCGHNAKEFDYPYIARRMLINRIPLPRILDISGKKPWEVRHLDTMQQWKFGDYKNYTSLKVLAHVFGLPTPKADIDGSQVGHVYWEERDLPRIVRYCQLDVVTLVQVYLALNQMPMLRNDQIIEPEVT